MYDEVRRMTIVDKIVCEDGKTSAADKHVTSGKRELTLRGHLDYRAFDGVIAERTLNCIKIGKLRPGGNMCGNSLSLTGFLKDHQ